MAEPDWHVDFFFQFRRVRGFSLRQLVQIDSTLSHLHLRDAYTKRIEQRNEEFYCRIAQVLGFPRKRPKRSKAWRRSQLRLLDQSERLLLRWRGLIRRMDRHRDDFPECACIPWTARNCQPAFFPVKGQRQRVYCCHRHFCPFCHARRVWDFYERIVYSLTAANWEGQMLQQVVPIADVDLCDHVALRQCIRRAYSAIWQYRRRQPPADGTVSFVQVIPRPKEPIARVQIKQLAYWVQGRPRAASEEWPATTYDVPVVKPVAVLTMSSVRRAVCSVLRYPPAWLYRPAPQLMRVLQVIHDKNILFGTGVFQHKVREIVDETGVIDESNSGAT